MSIPSLLQISMRSICLTYKEEEITCDNLSKTIPEELFKILLKYQEENFTKLRLSFNVYPSTSSKAFLSGKMIRFNGRFNKYKDTFLIVDSFIKEKIGEDKNRENFLCCRNNQNNYGKLGNKLLSLLSAEEKFEVLNNCSALMGIFALSQIKDITLDQAEIKPNTIVVIVSPKSSKENRSKLY